MRLFYSLGTLTSVLDAPDRADARRRNRRKAQVTGRAGRSTRAIAPGQAIKGSGERSYQDANQRLGSGPGSTVDRLQSERTG